MPQQLRMVWPRGKSAIQRSMLIPSGYNVRTYQPGDEAAFFSIMTRVGWRRWNEERLRPWLLRILPDGWFFVATADANCPVATAMALRDMCEFGEQGGELGWVACDPDHQGQGLGLIVTVAATARMLAEGYRHVHLYTEDWRRAAIKTYFKAGYVPYIDEPATLARWRDVCNRIHWPFTPSSWIGATGAVSA